MSAMDLKGESFLTTTIMGSALSRAMGAKSSRLYVLGRPKSSSTSGMTEMLTSAESRVYPSGLLTAADCMPTAPAAPGLFTTATGCLRDFSRPAATGRAVRSATPPGGKGTMIWMGLEGYVSAGSKAGTATRLTKSEQGDHHRQAFVHSFLLLAFTTDPKDPLLDQSFPALVNCLPPFPVHALADQRFQGQEDHDHGSRQKDGRDGTLIKNGIAAVGHGQGLAQAHLDDRSQNHP